jgi:signal peptide peptidase SppA
MGRYYRKICQAFFDQPLALLPSKIAEIRAFLLRKMAGEEVPADQVAAIAAARRDSTGVQMAGRIAVVPVFGVIAQRIGLLEESSGGVSTEELGITLDNLAADRGVGSIVLAFDSPGGSVFGVSELAEKIRGIRDQKRVVAIADSVAASAAYWLASQCSEVKVTPGGQVGSIGVVAVHEDLSRAEENLGVKTTLVSAGEHKTEGNPHEPLSEQARADIQEKVDYYYSLFVGDVAKGRGVKVGKVERDFGQGRMFTADEGVQAGLADGVATLQEVIDQITTGNGGAGSRAAIARAPAGLEARREARRRQLEEAEKLTRTKDYREAELRRVEGVAGHQTAGDWYEDQLRQWAAADLDRRGGRPNA